MLIEKGYGERTNFYKLSTANILKECKDTSFESLESVVCWIAFITVDLFSETFNYISCEEVCTSDFLIEKTITISQNNWIKSNPT